MDNGCWMAEFHKYLLRKSVPQQNEFLTLIRIDVIHGRKCSKGSVHTLKMQQKIRLIKCKNIIMHQPLLPPPSVSYAVLP